jgi:glycine/D-amino acid oxidase-like deaminating enzyme
MQEAHSGVHSPMDLVCGTPLWPTLDGLPAAYPALHRDLRCDVAVIGGGITGALVAHRFAGEGVNTVLLEADEVGRGSTSATTALIQYEIDTHLTDLIGRIGEARAVRSYRLCLDAVAGIGDLARTLDPQGRCAWRATSSLYLASRRADVPGLEAEHAARRAIGIDVQLLTERDLRRRFSFTRPAALRSALAGELDAFKLAYLLLAHGASAGLAVFDRTRVVRYEATRTGVRLGTDRGHTVRARRAVFATGYETPEFLDRKIVRLHDTFAIATAPVERFDGWSDDRCLIWETARPYFYARATGDGRVVMGGADRPFATAQHRRRLLLRQTRRVESQFRRLFPAIPFDVDWRWGGTFGDTRDGLPYIGTVRQFPHGYFALGYGGNGITFSWIAANLLLDRFLDRRNPDAELFDFDR